MLPEGTLRAHHVWKRFRADRRRTLLRDELQRLRSRITGGHGGWNWALRDIHFSVERGESIGFVGRNGSGKSTLLKILTRVMYPSAGRVDVSGRVGALIEVRAGIHPDLTGRENTFLYGSLLGLKRREVARRFDDIVAFAELKDAIDRQTKFYSTGMQMRLGFAVAAFLEPHALLVDEVLAVGDATFQQRCLDRMRQVISQGTTLVFVSHDLAAVEATCRRGIWLDHGRVQEDGAINDVLRSYRRSIEEAAEATPRLAGIVELLKAEVGGPSGSSAKSHEALEIMLRIASEEPRESRIYLGVSEGPAATIFSLRRDIHLSMGETVIKCTIRSLPLPRGRYYVWVGVYEGEGELDLLAWHPAAHFDVIGPDLDRTPTAVARVAPIHVDARWDVT